MRQLMQSVAIAVLSCIFATAWSVTSFAEPETITEFTAETVAEALRDGGATRVDIKKEENLTVISFSYDDGGPYLAVLSLCGLTDFKGCQALVLLVVIDKDDKYSLEKINKYNNSNPVGTAFRFSDGDIGIARVEFAFGGRSPDNLSAEAVLFSQTPKWFLQHVNQEPEVAAKGEFAEPVALPLVEASAGVRYKVPTMQQLRDSSRLAIGVEWSKELGLPGHGKRAKPQ